MPISGLDLLEKNAPNSNLPPFDIKVPDGTSAEELAEKVTKVGQVKSGLELLETETPKIVEKTVVPPKEKVIDPESYNIESLMGKLVPKSLPDVAEDEKKKESYGAALALNRLWSLAKNPYDVVKGSAEFVASLPGFALGVGGAAWNLSKALGSGANLEQAYEAAAKGMEENAGRWQQSMVEPLGRLLDMPKTLGTKAAELVTGKELPQPKSDSAFVGELAMAPLTAVTTTAHKIADAEWLDSYPNVRGAIRFGGDVLGLLTIGRIYRGGSSEYAKDVEPIINKAGEIDKRQKVIDEIPNEAIKAAQEKVLEVEKVQLELEAKRLQEKLDHEKIAKEDLKAKGEEVKEARKQVNVQDLIKEGKAKVVREGKSVKSINELEQPTAKSGLDVLEPKPKVIKRKGGKKEEVVEPKPSEPITDVDLQTGTPLPKELGPAEHPFRDKDVAQTNTMSKMFIEKIKNKEVDPEVFTRYLINEVNRHLNGEEPATPIEKVINGLRNAATNAENARLKFDTRADFEEWRSTVQEAARWAGEAVRFDQKRSSGKGDVQLNMMIPVNELPERIKEIFKTIKSTDMRLNSLHRNKEIFDSTGFWLGKDGKWRYEIDDKKIETREYTPYSPKPLSEYLIAPDLFKAVPELKDVQIQYKGNIAPAGDYNPSNKTITIKSIGDRNTFTHELQHAINDIVGSKFRGSNVEAERFRIDKGILDRIKAVTKTDEVRQLLNKIYEDYNIIDRNHIEVAMHDMLDASKDPAEANAIAGALRDYTKASALENYMKDPGEMEARLASKRMNMPADQRKVTPPWITLDNMLYQEGLGEGKTIATQEKIGTRYSTTPDAGLKLYMGIDPTQIPEATRKIIEGAKALARYTANARGLKAFKPGAAVEKVREELTRSFIDRSGNIRKELLDELGNDGYEIVQKMYLSKGASSLAAQQLKQMRKEVYDGLTKDDKRILDNLILADRIIDIGKYKTKAQFKFPEGLNPEQAAAYNELFQYIEKVPAEKAELLQQRAQSYFDWMKKPLQDMLDAELISQGEFDALSSHNYRRLKLVDVFDKRYQTKIGKKMRTVYDSGVEALSHGRDTDVFEPSSEVMALEVFNRAYGRILNNAANRTLLDLARTQKDNPFVAVKDSPSDHIPSGWDRVFVYEKGERKAVYLSPEMSKEWITNNPEMSYKLSQFIRYASGSTVLRTFATGIDWGFALANLPRDIMHIWYASRVFENGEWKPLYNSTLPVYGGQMAGDIGGVFNDAILRKGKYQDYIKEGGGMEFLVHQGRLLQRGRHLEGPLDNIQDFLGYLGETSEIVTRLAVRDRVIKRRAAEQGISYEEAAKDKKITTEATFAARDYMDFGQGGGISKALDNGLPYLNASIQGTRGMFRAFKDNPAQSTYKLAQFAALVTGLYIANQSINPETMKDLKGDINMQGNLVIPLGDGFGFLDEKGQKRYPFIKIPLDPGQKFFKMFFEAAYDKHTGQTVDVDGLTNSLSQISPVGISSLPPTVSGTLGYIMNKDFWLNEEIWKKTDKPLGWPSSKEEFIPGKTPEAMIDIGAVTGLSPERLKYALSELVTSGSPWSWLVGQGYDAAFKTLPAEKKEQHLAEVLSKTPIAKRFIGITNPYSKFATPVEEAREEGMLKRWVENRGLDQRVDSFLFEGGKRADVIEYINHTSKDAATHDRLKDRFIFSEKIKDLPNRSFWLAVKGTPDTEARAKLFVQRFDTADPREKEQLNKEIEIVQSAGGIISDEFKQAVMKIRDQKAKGTVR